MPHALINELNVLLEQPFPSQLKTTTPVLGQAGSELSDEILECVDRVAEVARATFGSKIQPTTQQSNILAEHGFRVKPGKISCGVWQSGVIETPKGLIPYR